MTHCRRVHPTAGVSDNEYPCHSSIEREGVINGRLEISIRGLAIATLRRDKFRSPTMNIHAEVTVERRTFLTERGVEI